MCAAQQYCLRWNNHRSNLLTVFEELLQNEAFTDVTLACEGGNPIKCHRMVLAACSPYFQNLFTDLPCKHPVVVLKDVKFTEIKAILEYMYRGEVNVAQDQLAALLKVAEALKVKGLVEENRSGGTSFSSSREDEIMDHSPTGIGTSSSNNNNPNQNVHSSSNNSPPHSTSSHYKSPYGSIYSGKAGNLDRSSRMNLPLWPIAGLPIHSHTSPVVPNQSHPHAAATAAAAMLSGCYEAGDMSPLRRKKISSLLNMNRDTPILRTVLGQGQADSSQPVSLVCHPDSNEQGSNGPHQDRMEKHMKTEPSEDAQSPYTDFSVMHDDEEKSRLASPSSSPQSYSSDFRITSGIATYVPNQNKEFKRYKQYTPNDIMSAIQDVKNGVSALQAAKKYKVPSRTLYDKVKKMGITTSRPFKRGSNGSPACFPYRISGRGSPYGGHISENDDAPTNNNTTALLEATFLQHVLDSRGGVDDGSKAFAAMTQAAAQAAVQGHGLSSSPSNQGHARSPNPSPTLMKYMSRYNSMTPSPAAGSDHHLSETNLSSEQERDEEDEQVEDLSIGRKLESGVIMPPMSLNQVSTIMKKEEFVKEMIKEEARREHMKTEPSEDAQSPYTDFAVMNEDEEKSRLAIPSSSPQSFSNDIRITSGIATYVPNQNKEWKRYKQYTRDDIMSAIQDVKNGMSALQAARKYKVPSRTLYDKVKKMGITTSRPFKRGSNGSPACFPYGISGTGSPYGGHISENDDPPTNNNTSALLEATFLQHVLDSRGRADDSSKAFAAMTQAAAQAAVQGHGLSTSPSNHGRARSPSPSSTLMKYMSRHNSMTPSPAAGSDHHLSETNGSSERDRDEEDDQVEDLSVGRKLESGVIMPPMNQKQVFTIMKKEEFVKEMIKEEARREVSVEEAD